jgi:hypothetical protein
MINVYMANYSMHGSLMQCRILDVTAFQWEHASSEPALRKPLDRSQ